MNQKLIIFFKTFFDKNGAFLPKISEEVSFSDLPKLTTLKAQIEKGDDLPTEAYRVAYKSLFQPLVVSRSTEVDLTEALQNCKDVIDQISPAGVKNPNFTRKLGVLGYWFSNDPLTYIAKLSCLLDGGNPLFMDSIDEAHSHLQLMLNRLEKTELEVKKCLNYIRLLKVAYEQYLLFDSLCEADIIAFCKGDICFEEDVYENLTVAFSSYCDVKDLELLCTTYDNELSPKLQEYVGSSLILLDKTRSALGIFWGEMSTLIAISSEHSFNGCSIDIKKEDVSYEIVDDVLYLGRLNIEEKRKTATDLLEKSENELNRISLDFNRCFSMYAALLAKVDINARVGLKAGEIILS
ncbi:TPA: hypothetical protein I7730_01340 [Vibrio vulnificus]|uniref:Uncharacterized protein n=1 Tax=Vibrio vulnificus TaxID=672 RepID=A0A8H9MZ92_VIBVL|nr:hypothetical protein [Vibrio vulnificus]HAS8538440.1 hypothetical protein [Vibrio vulnificus]